MLLATSKQYPKIQGMTPCYYPETGKGQTESGNKEKQIQELLIQNALLASGKKALQSQLLSADLGWCYNTPLQTDRLWELGHQQAGAWVLVWFLKTFLRKTQK